MIQKSSKVSEKKTSQMLFYYRCCLKSLQSFMRGKETWFGPEGKVHATKTLKQSDLTLQACSGLKEGHARG